MYRSDLPLTGRTRLGPYLRPSLIVLCGLHLKRLGTLIAQGRMQALTIINQDQVVNHAQRGVSPCFWWLVREAFFFQTSEHPFHHRIIITVPLPTHTADHVGVPKLALILHTGILTATIRMMQQPRLRLALPDGHLQRLCD